MRFSSLNTHVQSLASEVSLMVDKSMIIPPVVPAARHLSGPESEPRRVTTVSAEVTGAPSATSLELLGHTRRDA